MKKTIKDYDLRGKKVIIRVDFNVPIENGKITDDSRIVGALDTIRYAKEKGAKVILMSHLGRVKEEADKEKHSLKIVCERLIKLLKDDVIFVESTRGEILENAINNLKDKEILLMENTRFEDIDGNRESGNDEELGKYWASLGDIFINDAFGVSHRKCASVVGIASNLKNGIGFLIEKELNSFKILDKPKRPYTIILGGAKVSDKIGVIDTLIKVCDYMLIGGAMSNTFMSALGYNVGESLVDEDYIDYAKELIKEYKDKIILPIDSIIEGCELKEYNEINNSDKCLDIGSKTIEKFKSILSISNTIVWNGPLGYFEKEEYSFGTYEILNYLSDKNKVVILGGGDTASAALNLGFKDKFTHISTGGGASLELLEGKELVGIDIIEEV